MPLVRIKQKFQVTIPDHVRKQAGLEVGDLLEATAKGNVITLKPKAVVDRHPAVDARLREALDDVKAGRVYGPFNSAKELVSDLRAKDQKGKGRENSESPVMRVHYTERFLKAYGSAPVRIQRTFDKQAAYLVPRYSSLVPPRQEVRRSKRHLASASQSRLALLFPDRPRHVCVARYYEASEMMVSLCTALIKVMYARMRSERQREHHTITSLFK